MELHFTAMECHLPYGITHPTQANTPRLNSSHTGRYSICRPQKDGRLSKHRPRVQRATGPRLLCDRLQPARLASRPRDR